MKGKILQRFSVVIFCAVVFFTIHALVLAASFSLQSNQSAIGTGDEYTVNATLSISASDGTQYFLRGVFYQPGTSNYCGYTYNGSSYYNGPYTTNNGWQNVLPITVQNSSWSGTLKAKIDSSDSGCQSSGTYNFKIQRFTTSGSGTFDNQNEQTISVIIPTPTPTNSPTSIPAATSTPVPTTKITSSPTPIKSGPTPKPTLTPFPTVLSASTSSQTDDSGLSTENTPTGEGLVAGISDERKPLGGFNPFAIALIVIGVGIILTCGILFFREWKKSRLRKDTDEVTHE